MDAITEAVFEHIKSHPGDRMLDIARAVGIPLSSVSVAVTELRRAEMIDRIPFDDANRE